MRLETIRLEIVAEKKTSEIPKPKKIHLRKSS